MIIKLVCLGSFLVMAVISIIVHNRNGKHALVRLKHIKTLVEDRKGYVYATVLHTEGMKLCRRYGIMPQDFGYDNFAEFKQSADKSVRRASKYASMTGVKKLAASLRDENLPSKELVSYPVIIIGVDSHVPQY